MPSFPWKKMCWTGKPSTHSSSCMYPAIKGLRGGGDVKSASLDLGYNVREGVVVASRTIPAQTALLAGMHGVDIMFSTYLTAAD